ncbi:MAG: type 4a pilus biogenesis protein PilO [Actinomycetota bacterium]|nr:type 4a pilus biogenesis protein PilO [Actinomycetota bacterium]
MNQRTRIILAGVAAFFVCLLFFFFFIRPRQGELADVNQSIEGALNEQQGLEQQLAQLEALKEQAPQMNALLDEIRGYVPKNIETANFILQVQEAANLAGVDVLQLTPELPKVPLEGAALAEIRVTMRASGGYFALQDFVRRLYDLDRAVRIDTLNLSRLAGEEGAGADEVEMTATARVFFEVPAGAAAAPPAEAPVAPEPAPETPQQTG